MCGNNDNNRCCYERSTKNLCCSKTVALFIHNRSRSRSINTLICLLLFPLFVVALGNSVVVPGTSTAQSNNVNLLSSNHYYSSFGCYYYAYHHQPSLSFVNPSSTKKNFYKQCRRRRQRVVGWYKQEEIIKNKNKLFHQKEIETHSILMQSSGDQKSGHDDDDGNGDDDDDAAINYGMNSQRKKKLTISNNNNPTSHSRRDFLLQNVAISSILLGTLSSNPSEASSSTRTTITDIFPSLTLSNNSSSSSSSSDNNEIIDPIDIQKVLQQNKINVTITNNKSQSQIYINQTSLDKMSVPIPPLSSSSPSSSYSPSFKNKALPLSSWLKQNVNYQLKQRQYPYPQTVERIPDSKLFIASVIAGSFTEVIRSVVLYPITTIKSRVQYHPPMRLSFIDKLKSFDLRRIGSIDKRGSAGNLSQEEEEKKSVLIVLDDNVGVEVQDHQTHSMIDHGNVVVAVDDDDDDDDKYQKNNATLSLQDITYNSTSARNINETKLILPPPPLLQQDQPKRLMTNLYAGILPQLIATVPACGIFFAVKDITKRELIKAIESSSSSSSSSFSYIASIDDLTLTLFSVFLGDVFSLAIKTPALTLSTRAQVETMIDDDIDLNMGESLDCNSTTTSKPTGTRRTTMDVFQDSWKKLPIVILTDLPYLFLKIVLVRSLATGQENIAEYALLNTAVSCICAGITTPFDVVRTRVLVDSNGDPSDGLDGGLINSDDEGYRKRGGNLKNIIYTMKLVMNETDANNDFALQEEDDIDNSSCELQEGGGTALEKNKQYFNAQNLFAGWYERVLYLGLSVAWFDSLRILSYVGIRDFVLLKIFH